MIVFLFALLITIAGVGYWVLQRKGPLRMVLLPLRKEKPEEPVVQNPKAAPEFIDELRKREESMKSEFAAAKKREIDREEIRQKEKEIVVVLPENSHKYEEDK